MQATAQVQIPNDIMHAGVDWITGTAKEAYNRMGMEEFSRRQFERLADAGEQMKLQSRMGYVGYSTNHFFHGRRTGSSIIIASGHTASDIWRSVKDLSDNISRLDVAVTVATPEDRPHLAVQAYKLLSSSPPASVRVRNCTLIDTHPKGETCNVGKRSSDQSARIYDYATAHGAGEARSIWRYEVEFKRGLATSAATALRSSHSDEAVARPLVHAWFSNRGLAPIFSPGPLSCPQDSLPAEVNRDTLAWFRDSVSITVGRAIRTHGLPVVLDALGLVPIEAWSQEELTHEHDS